MNKLDIQIRLLDVIQERENTAFELKETNNGEEAMQKYRALDKKMNDLIKALAGGTVSEIVKALKQRIDELQNENHDLKDKNGVLKAENDTLNEKILDLEACR